MIRPIVLYGSEILRTKCAPVSLEDPKLSEFIQDLWDTMYNANGIGLAAPQIGYTLQIFVADGTSMAEKYPEVSDFKETFINPVLIKVYGELWTYEEGCLSIPDVHAEIQRPYKVTVKYYDAQRQLQQKTFHGLAARIILHEYDHLQGRLFIDYLSPLRRRLLKKRLQQVKQGKIETTYPVVTAEKARLFTKL